MIFKPKAASSKPAPSRKQPPSRKPDVGIRRPPGRPQLRSDDETRRMIADAARTVFIRSGYLAASVDEVARTAGISKKTLYRLVSTKADLFRLSLSERMQQFILALDDKTRKELTLEESLERLLTQYGLLTLNEGTIALNRLVIAESDKFPEVAAAYYEHAVVASQAIMTRYLEDQCKLGRLVIDDCSDAAGMLRGMMILEPQRAVMLTHAKTLDAKEIAARARRCARLFLIGYGHCTNDQTK